MTTAPAAPINAFTLLDVCLVRRIVAFSLARG
jgi:hypothetical protein